MATDSRTVRPRSSVWLSDKPAPRRKADQQPTGLDRVKIIAATIRLLDAEGLAKFSMRRLAAELGVTAMSVYWYVETKEDLLELVVDVAMGEIVLPSGVSAPADLERAGAAGEREAAGDAPALTAPPSGEQPGWREQMRQLAAGYRRLLVIHPWMSPLLGEYLNIGPNSMAFSHAAQRVMRSSGLPMEKVPSALSLVYQFVYGFGTIEGRFANRCREAGVSQDQYYNEVMGIVAERPEFDESREVMEARHGNTVEEIRDRDFTFALDCAIAGIEALRDGHGASGT